MNREYPTYKSLDLSQRAKDILSFWESEDIFKRSVQEKDPKQPFIFFEGPPSANGMPGIHHAMARAIKDLFCRYKTLKGYRVERKAGWDTHGLPVELGVEKELGITKEDIGTKISVEEYNNACKKAVMRYTDVWNDLTRKMGYWVDMDHPYITYENKYIESVWWLLKDIYKKDLMYKGYTIQPYSPKAGTGLSSHELNQPGTYQDVKDSTVVAQFKVKDESLEKLRSFITSANSDCGQIDFLAWTTTPWTLPSNTALCVGPKIEYQIVNTRNKYTDKAITVVLAKDLVSKHFPVAKDVDFEILGTVTGADLKGLKYEQLLPYATPMDQPEMAFQVITGSFVTTEDGTGIVHIAPTFGADDMNVARDAGVPPMMVSDENGNPTPLVDLQGRFVKQMGELAGKYVKNEYYDDGKAPDRSVDVEIIIKLKEENKAFNAEKYAHSYPHCWRTDKPILYYPLDSWFIKVTKVRDRMVELNNTINWKPKSTGTGRFGNWLENANDWNLSRSRYWGIPIPIWRSEDGTEEICIGSVEELQSEILKSMEAGFMDKNPLKDFNPSDMSDENYHTFDLHKNYVDEVVLVSESGQKLTREADLIDVWFDSGAMPYAQWHYPFENKEKIDSEGWGTADFIAEGVDQTRGWFYTLHTIATMCFDRVAYKNVVSNGLVLDKKGQKMSKRLGNAVEPFGLLEREGPDATRWYMITNAQPWDNLKFDEAGITESKRKFFGTLYNTYSFYALYANVDGFHNSDPEISLDNRPEIDRWILSKLNTLIIEVDSAYSDYEPTKAGRLIQEFVVDQLSNWYVRLCRRRFWRGEVSEDKKSAYQTLHKCLKTVAIMSSPIAPFFMDSLYQDLSNAGDCDSVHLTGFPKENKEEIDTDLEQRMEIAQKVSSMILRLRKKENIKVRQPLKRVMIPILDDEFERRLKAVEPLILSEVNLKEIEYLKDSDQVLVKNIKPDFKKLGPKFGKDMKIVASAIQSFDQTQIAEIETNGEIEVNVGGNQFTISIEEVEIIAKDIPGWLVTSDGSITVALDITLDDVLIDEGLAREIVNRVQNLRKETGLEVTDRISLKILKEGSLERAIENNLNYICSETLADKLELVENISNGISVDLSEELKTKIEIQKLN